MAVGDSYCSVDDARDYCQIADTIDDLHIETVCGAISRGIERWCDRQFNDVVTPSARLFHPADTCLVEVTDFHTVTGLVVKTDAGDGLYGTTVAATDFTLYPLDGVVAGRPGHPFNVIGRHTGTWPTSNGRPTVQVTARWGWAAVPDDVKLAALMQAARKFRRRYSPSGVQTVGSGDMAFTSWVSRIADPDVKELLEPYRRTGVA